MKVFGILIAAAAGLLLLSGTLAGDSTSLQAQSPAIVAASETGLPAWHPPVHDRIADDGAPRPALPEGHPPIPDELVCPVTGAVRMPGVAPKAVRAPVEGLVRI